MEMPIGQWQENAAAYRTVVGWQPAILAVLMPAGQWQGLTLDKIPLNGGVRVIPISQIYGAIRLSPT